MITLRYRFNACSNSQIFEFPSIHGIEIVELKSILELYHFGRSSLAFETFIGKRTSYNFGVFYVKKHPNYGFSLKLEKSYFSTEFTPYPWFLFCIGIQHSLYSILSESAPLFLAVERGGNLSALSEHANVNTMKWNFVCENN